MPTLSLAAPRPGSGPDRPSDRCTWYALLGPRQGFAVSDMRAHLPLPWGLQLEPCHRLAERRPGGRQLRGSRRGGGWAGHSKVWWLWAHSPGRLHQGNWLRDRKTAKAEDERKKAGWKLGRRQGREVGGFRGGLGVGAGGWAEAGGFSRGAGPQAGLEPSLGTG